jgi:Flp pilus assembly protein CpaB
MPICRNGLIAILFVLLAIATTGWIVTATRKPATEPETVEVLVAVKDLPVGTMLTCEDLKEDTVVKTKKVPKNDLPPAFVTNREDLVGKRLSRPIHAEEMFNPQDLIKGGNISSYHGDDIVSLRVGVGQATAEFVGPGSRVNVLATVRSGNKLRTFPLLANMLVVAVDMGVSHDTKGVLPNLSMGMVSFCLTEKQALLLSLAKSRGYTLELVLRDPTKSEEADKDYDIDKVIKMLSDETGGAPPVPGAEPVEVAPPPRPVGENR